MQPPTQEPQQNSYNPETQPLQQPVSPFDAALVQTPPTNKKKTVFAAIGVIVGVLLVAGAVGAYVMFGMVTPEERFQHAIENHLKVTHIKQDYKTKSVATQISMSAESESDFTDPALPKTKATYNLSVDDSTGSTDSGTVTFAGEIIIENNDGFYAKMSQMPELSSRLQSRNPVIGQWYKIQKDDAVSKLNFDFPGIESTINTPLGEFIVGNYNQATRNELLGFIEKNQVYMIKDSQQEQYNGADATTYAVELNYDNLAKLNKLVADKFKLSYNSKKYTARAKDGPIEWRITVDNKTEQIVKSYLTRTAKNSEGRVLGQDTSETIISYPASTTITKPASSKPSPLAFDL